MPLLAKLRHSQYWKELNFVSATRCLEMTMKNNGLADQQATLVVDGSFGHRLQHLNLQFLGRLSQLMSTGVVNDLLPSFRGGKGKNGK